MRTKPLSVINPTPEGVILSVDFMNSMIDRIEDLVLQAQLNKPLAGDNVQISYTANGALINAVT